MSRAARSLCCRRGSRSVQKRKTPAVCEGQTLRRVLSGLRYGFVLVTREFKPRGSDLVPVNRTERVTEEV